MSDIPIRVLIGDDHRIVREGLKQVLADAPSDPEYAKQWYLGAINAAGAWNAGYTGRGVKVLVTETSGKFAVASQAADLNHPDLIANKSANFNDTQDHSAHATAVAGVIALMLLRPVLETRAA